jgi:hypothetical protein
MRSKHWMPKDVFIVAVTRGRRGLKTYYFYGSTLKEARAAANLKDGEVFTYCHYKGGRKVVAEMAQQGDVMRTYR